MADDKKITELQPIPDPPTVNDIFLAVRGDVDYKVTGQQLIDFVAAVLAVGSVVTFSNDTPPNSDGKNGDVVIKPASGQFLQRVAGVWVLQYTTPPAGSGTTVIYGIGVPSNITGNNGDTYIDTAAGKFYKKAAGVWGQVFSMASGPPGAPGDPGAPGADGTNGNTILNGITPPSNMLGANGDFYLNTNTYFIYGPKAAGVWGPGTSIISTGPNFKQAYNYDVGDTRFSYDSVNMELTFTLSVADQLLFPYSAQNGILKATLREKYSATRFRQRNSFDPIITDNGTVNISVFFDGITADLLTNVQIILS